MNENAKKWVEALRSGEYQQGQTYLSRDGRYCCLGVACEVAIARGIPIAKEPHSSGIIYYDGDVCVLPQSVREWIGLASGLGKFNDSRDSLYILNDQQNKSFAEIADVIESEPPGLFLSHPPAEKEEKVL